MPGDGGLCLVSHDFRCERIFCIDVLQICAHPFVASLLAQVFCALHAQHLADLCR